MVIEQGLAYEEQPVGLSSAARTLDAVAEAETTLRRAEVAKLVAVLAWAHSHPGTGEDSASWDPALLSVAAGQGQESGEDGVDRLGGPGTPAVAEFAVEQLATRLHVTTGSAMRLVADVLDLAHRHPILWTRVTSGGCPVWLARHIAATCSTLPATAAAWVDAQVGHTAGRCPTTTVEARLAYASATWDPERTRAAEEQAHDARHLDIDLPGPAGTTTGSTEPGGLAVASIRGRLSTIDAIKFDALVAAKAHELATAGDTASLDIRRAKALGLIADQLLTGELDLGLVPTTESAADTADDPDADADPRGSSRTRKSCQPATLFVHVSVEDLLAHQDGHTGLGGIEKLGPASLDLLADWLAQTDLTITPVLDAGRADGVDAHDPPAWMRELVIGRDHHCAFPHCNRDARACDIDHIVPYVSPDNGGPPDQTTPANLAPLCRRHHRCKTFTRWRYHRLPTGDYEWTDPNGTVHTAPI